MAYVKNPPPVPRDQNIENWVRHHGEVARPRIEAIVRDIETMEQRHGYRYDEVVPWEEWYKPLPCCARECCR